MNQFEEEPVWFDCEGQSLLGIVSRPSAGARAGLGVVMIVGGPQYRVGSHRQYTLLARRLATEGFPTLRFDYRGMGDSTGDPRSFTEIGSDIEAAIRTLKDVSGVRAVVLWGLCDAASAVLLMVQGRADVAGLVLVNPWVTEPGHATSIHLKYYYVARFKDATFWRKLLGGKVSPWRSIRSLVTNASTMLSTRAVPADRAVPFQTRMAAGWRSFEGPILLALSGNDFTSRQFIDCASQRSEWSGLLAQERVTRRDLAEADHTFSSRARRAWLEHETVDWLRNTVARAGRRTPAHIRT